MKTLIRRIFRRPDPEPGDLAQYDRRNARVEIVLSMGRLHLCVNGFVVATEGDVCRDSYLSEISFSGAWTKERMIEAATGSAPR